MNQVQADTLVMGYEMIEKVANSATNKLYGTSQQESLAEFLRDELLEMVMRAENIMGLQKTLWSMLNLRAKKYFTQQFGKHEQLVYMSKDDEGNETSIFDSLVHTDEEKSEFVDKFTRHSDPIISEYCLRVAAGEKVTRKGIAEEFGVSERTVRRKLKSLAD